MTENSYKADIKNLSNPDGPLLQKRLAFKSTIDQLEFCTSVIGVTKAEDLIIKAIHELHAHLERESTDLGFVKMK